MFSQVSHLIPKLLVVPFFFLYLCILNNLKQHLVFWQVVLRKDIVNLIDFVKILNDGSTVVCFTTSLFFCDFFISFIFLYNFDLAIIIFECSIVKLELLHNYRGILCLFPLIKQYKVIMCNFWPLDLKRKYKKDDFSLK